MDEVRQQITGELPEEQVSGVSTGWKVLDELYRPVPGELTIVTGTPGSGKTEWLLSLLSNLAEGLGQRFAVCAMETTARDLALQLFEKRHKRNFRDLDSKGLDQAWLKEHFHVIGGGFQELTIDRILMDAQYVSDRFRDTGGVHGLMIDPFNYIEQGPGFGSETDYVSAALTKVRQFAARNSCHVWLVVHPVKRNTWKDVRPTLYDCAGSAHFFNKCDMGLVLERNRDEKKGGGLNLLQVHVDKVRNKEAGSLGMAQLWFRPRQRDFSVKHPLEDVTATAWPPSAA